MKKIEKPLTYILSILVIGILLMDKLSEKQEIINNEQIKTETSKINVDSIINAILQEKDNQE